MPIATSSSPSSLIPAAGTPGPLQGACPAAWTAREPATDRAGALGQEGPKLQASDLATRRCCAPGLPPRTPRLWARSSLLFDHPAALRGTRQEFPRAPRLQRRQAAHSGLTVTTWSTTTRPDGGITVVKARVRGWPAKVTMCEARSV